MGSWSAAFLNLILAGKAGDVITRGSLGCSSCEIVECKTEGCGEGKQQSTHVGLGNSSTEDNLVFVTCHEYPLAV